MSREWLRRSCESHGGADGSGAQSARSNGSSRSKGRWPWTYQGGTSSEAEAGGSSSRRKIADLVAQVRELGAEHIFEGVRALGEGSKTGCLTLVVHVTVLKVQGQEERMHMRLEIVTLATGREMRRRKNVYPDHEGL